MKKYYFTMMGCLAVAAGAVFCGGFSSSADASTGGRVLAETEMAAIIGFGCNMCENSVTCNVPLKYGTGDCKYCKDDTEARKVCCDMETGGEACGYVGDADRCDSNKQRMVGPVDGEYGTCGTCTSDQYAGDGTCSNGLQTASSKKVCPF